MPNSIAVAANAQRPNAAVLFFDYMLSDAQKILADRDYVVTNTKVPSPIDRSTMHVMDSAKVLQEGEKWQTALYPGDLDAEITIQCSSSFGGGMIGSNGAIRCTSCPSQNQWSTVSLRSAGASTSMTISIQQDGAGRGRHAERLHAAGRGARAVPMARRSSPTSTGSPKPCGSPAGPLSGSRPPTPTRRSQSWSTLYGMTRPSRTASARRSLTADNKGYELLADARQSKEDMIVEKKRFQRFHPGLVEHRPRCCASAGSIPS